MKFLPYVEAFAQGFFGVMALSPQFTGAHVAAAVYAGTLAALNLHKSTPTS